MPPDPVLDDGRRSRARTALRLNKTKHSGDVDAPATTVASRPWRRLEKRTQSGVRTRDR